MHPALSLKKLCSCGKVFKPHAPLKKSPWDPRTQHTFPNGHTNAGRFFLNASLRMVLIELTCHLRLHVLQWLRIRVPSSDFLALKSKKSQVAISGDKREECCAWTRTSGQAVLNEPVSCPDAAFMFQLVQGWAKPLFQDHIPVNRRLVSCDCHRDISKLFFLSRYKSRNESGGQIFAQNRMDPWPISILSESSRIAMRRPSNKKVSTWLMIWWFRFVE